MTGTSRLTAELVYSATPRLRRLATVAALSVATALVTAHGELLAVAAVPLVLLVTSSRSRLPRSAEVVLRPPERRCVEGDGLVLEVDLVLGDHDRVVGALSAPPHTDVTFLGEVGTTTDGGRTLRWLLVPRRWGRYDIGPLRLQVLAGGSCYSAPLEVPTGEVVVYPAAGAVARAVAPRELAAPLGEHPSRSAGAGVEFAGVRAYQPGDRRRDIDWRTSARHGDLFVRRYADERAFDLVLVLDTTADAGEPGRSTLDLTVRAATGLATTYLRSHDRVGVVTFGGPLRWLSPATGPRQLFRICEMVMSVRPDRYERDAGTVEYGLENLSVRMLPARAFVCVLTPLLDDRPLAAVRLLQDRGFAPLVVDVLTAEPGAEPGSLQALALRAWRLQREGLTVELNNLGVPVLPWDGEGDLTGALMHAMRAVPVEVRA